MPRKPNFEKFATKKELLLQEKYFLRLLKKEIRDVRKLLKKVKK